MAETLHPVQRLTNRMYRLKQFSGLAAMAAVCVIAAATPRAAQAAMSAGQAKASIEQQYDVKVLKIANSTLAGKPVYLLTIMSPGGASNSAFQVNRLAVDRKTGKLVSGVRHLPSGYDHAAGAGANVPNRQPTSVLRQGWNWR